MEFIKEIDLFSLPFQFSLMGKSKKKKTLIGGLISMIVVFTSLIYFIYLCYLYFGNQLQPSISSTLEYFHEEFKVQFDKNLIAFKVVLPNGMLIQDFERSKNKNYITILPTLSTKDQNGNEVYQNLSLIQCEDPDLKDYYCVDFSNVNQDQVNQPFLTYFPQDNQKQKLQVLMLYCDNNIDTDAICAKREETQNEIINFNTKVYTRVTSQQYNPSKRQFEKKIKLEQFYLSDNLVFLGKFSLKSTTTTINDGFIIQKQNSYTYISDYQKTNEYSTSTFMQNQIQLDMIGACFFYLDENGKNEYVQFVQFPSILAQFMSIFNSLLVIGIICREFSQSQMIQDFMEIQLKNYYKKSAIEFIHEVETKKQSKSISDYFQSNLMQTYKQISNMNYKYYMQQFLDTTFYNKIKLLIFSKGGKAKQNEPKQVKIYKKLMDSTYEQLSIYDIQKELLKLKMMVRMNYSVEQYAALQLCGLRILLDENIPNIDDSISENIQKEGSLLFDSVRSNEKVNEIKIEQQEQEKNLKPQQKEQLIQLNNQELQGIQNRKTDEQLIANINIGEIQNAELLEESTNKQQVKQSNIFDQEENVYKLDDNKNNQQFKRLNFKSISLNHLEKIERLEKDNKYFELKVNQFFNKTNLNTLLDQRILNCLITQKQYKLDTQSYIQNSKNTQK